MVNKGIKDKKVVCLGGGVGTVNLLKGLKKYFNNISTVVSMADDGGSAGRLRRLYNVLPFGDLVSCMAAMSTNQDKITKELLTYRFNGERYGKDTELGGHKLGNLIMVALKEITGDYSLAIEYFKKQFVINGNFFPATKDQVDISAFTVDGKEVFGEEKIDLGKYKGRRILEKVILHPHNAEAGIGVVKSILNADVIILGPGDLYTNLLPVIIVPEIKEALIKTKAQKFFIVNVANKPFETKGYQVSGYIDAIIRHVGSFIFDKVFVNSNTTVPIPSKYKYTYVCQKEKLVLSKGLIIEKDLIDNNFPLYHDPDKLAKSIVEQL